MIKTYFYIVLLTMIKSY